MSNVVQLFPKKAETVLPTIPATFGFIHTIADWAEEQGIDIQGNEFVYMCAEFMQRLQTMVYERAAA